MVKVLIVDDEESIRELISYNLKNEGFSFDTASTGEEALQKVFSQEIDLVLLDWMIPEPNGLEVCRRLRSNPQTTNLPVIMLTVKNEEIDKVLGLEMGADDYVTKPFSPRELVARVRANLRSQKNFHPEIAPDKTVINRKGLYLDKNKYMALKEEQSIDISPREFELLFMLASSPGRVFRREEILNRIWGYDFPVDTRTVDVHIRYLRQKIEDDPANPIYLITIRGVGYKFTVSD